MLSFMREQGIGELPENNKGTSAPPPSEDGVEAPKEQEYVSVAAKGSTVRKSTTLLAVLFIVGMLCLWFMIRKSTPGSASAEQVDVEQAKVEAAITKITGVKSEMSSRMGEIVNKFYEFSSVPQVEVTELVKNPFELETYLAGLREKLDSGAQDMAVSAEMLRLQQIKKQADSLELSSIMQSDQGNCCMISDKLLYEGDSTGDFKVVTIGDTSVKLRWSPQAGSSADEQAVEVVLKLSE